MSVVDFRWRQSFVLLSKERSGFSLIEVLLAIACFSLLTIGLVGAIAYGRGSTSDAGNRLRATQLADEGIQAVRNIRDAAYTNLTNNTFGLVQSGGVWTLSGTSDTTGIFTRQVAISSGGTNRESIAVTVSWPRANGTTASVTANSQLTNWSAAFKSWANAIVAGSAAATGTTAAVKVDTVGNYAYFVRSATTNNFVIADISNPAAPSLVSTTTFAGTPTDVFVSGSYAYVTTTTASRGLEIIKVSTPTAPSLTKSVALTGTSGANGVYVSGSYAYVVRNSDTGTNANEFSVVNVSNPGSAVLAGGYNNNIAMNAVYVSGNYAYVATSSTTQEMLVINVTTPATPTLAATYNPATTLTALAVTGSGNTVYLGMSTTLDAINVTTPTSPTRLGTFTAVGTIEDIDVDSNGQYAFLGTASTTGEFQVVNVTSPASMSLTKTVDVSGTTSTVNGVSYYATYDDVAGASASSTQQLLTFTKS